MHLLFAAFGLSPSLAVRLFSWCFLGVPFWAPCVFWILLELAGLELARPFRGPFWTRGGKGVSVLLFCGFCFPFCGVCGFTRFTRRPANFSTYGRPVQKSRTFRPRESNKCGENLRCLGVVLPHLPFGKKSCLFADLVGADSS